ncbi:MAG TPA: hypothetical protein VHE12_05855 [bacterium]|nr:hypothetical protein [bacterium]
MGFTDALKMGVDGLGSVIGGIQTADAAGDLEKKQKAAAAKALKDAQDFMTRQKAERDNAAQLSTAFNQLTSWQAQKGGSIYTTKMGLAG